MLVHNNLQSAFFGIPFFEMSGFSALPNSKLYPKTDKIKCFILIILR